MRFMYWIDLGEDYKPVQVLVVSREVMDTKAKDLGVYTSEDFTEGLWVPDENSVYLVDNPKHNSLEFILLHELIHCFDDLSSEHEDNERQTDCKASVLRLFLKHNPNIIEAINNKTIGESI